MTDMQARLERLEALQAIQQLPIRYALAVDGRDLDAWVGLFVEDVDCGRHGNGREALKRFIEPAVRGFYRSVHLICGHQIELQDAGHASGKVYCRAEHEDGDRWVVMAICYFDSYARQGGDWYFVRRQERHWYAADMLDRPMQPGLPRWPDAHAQPAGLPAAFASWTPFWADADPERLAALTRQPV